MVFEKNGKRIAMDDLSTGESQIVYRGAYLLKNVGVMPEGVVLIDEPELSLHPSWQTRILSYYRNLFVSNRSKVQIIVATHSLGVIQEALSSSLSPISKVIVLRNDTGKIVPGEITLPLVLNNCLAEIQYQAFNIASNDYHNALYGYIESMTDDPPVSTPWMPQYQSGKPMVPYIRLNKDGTTTTQNKTLSEKIRHVIHHPENTNNAFTNAELRRSIEDMRSFILSKI